MELSAETWVYFVVAVFTALAYYEGFWLVRESLGLYLYVRRTTAGARKLKDAEGRFLYQPRVAVILPCCGVDERLHQTVGRLGCQNYADYEIIFTLESEEDPAYEAIGRWTADWTLVRHRRVVAGLTQQRSQKIHNLLAAVEQVSPDREVLVFLDSDAVPSADWLGHLVAPLNDEAVGAATGFRWYCASGGIANGLRSVWNAASVTLIRDEQRNFCWGGATAVRLDRFKSLDIARRWSHALSDDYQMTRAVRDAGLIIRFVPQALIPSHDRTTLRGFFEFARRQLIITRVCAPDIWRTGLLLCTVFVFGGSAAAVLFFLCLLGWFGSMTAGWWAFAGWMVVMLLTLALVTFRQLAVRQILGPPDVTWKDAAWDIAGIFFAGMLHQSVFASSIGTRRFAWRNTVYEMISPDETRVIGRLDKTNEQ
ncbi:MAG TPA: glycosyltransferase [Phycisphaerae bacterium]|nr:glycosyltransferase [Phycisphaerae bacterium]